MCQLLCVLSHSLPLSFRSCVTWYTCVQSLYQFSIFNPHWPWFYSFNCNQLCLPCQLFCLDFISVGLKSALVLNSFAWLFSQQIHKQAPPMEDVAEDCSLAMRSFLERAMERNPALRSTASELLKDQAINPSREDQPRCWSLDSALEEANQAILRQQSQQHDTTEGKD